MRTLDKRFWLWGYTLEQIPGRAMFVDQKTRCSLETAAEYLGCGSVVWMNSAHDLAELDGPGLSYLAEIPQVVCGLTHIETNGPGKGGWERHYVESAAKISALSRRFPNIQGALIDDFLCDGPSKDITPEEVHEIAVALKSENPALKLYVVHYFDSQTPEILAPFRADLDAIVVWSWHSTDYFWKALYQDALKRLRECHPDKQIIQGLFVNAYGDGDPRTPQPMDQLELQCQCISSRLDAGVIDGWCALQNGQLCFESHRRQAMFLKDYWEWYQGTRTVRP